MLSGFTGRSSSSSVSALAAMMGMGNTGKGSAAGGTTTHLNVPIAGSAEDLSPDQRHVVQASGVESTALPGEFRDAIESYHRAMEKTP